MLKIILGVIVGFIVWSILWNGSDAVLTKLWPAWYGAHQDAVMLALANREAFPADTTIVLIGLLRSIIASILSGFVAAAVAGENKRSALILGILLLLVGVMVQVFLWNVFPIWYHFLFLFLLIPMTILGGKIKRSA